MLLKFLCILVFLLALFTFNSVSGALKADVTTDGNAEPKSPTESLLEKDSQSQTETNANQIQQNVTTKKAKTGKLNRIIGGHRAKTGQFPFIVSILIDEITHFCGGTIIHLRHVLTAGHCFYGDDSSQVDINKVTLIAGETNIAKQTSPHLQLFHVQACIVYPSYDGNKKSGDIAVIRLKETVKISPVVKIAKMTTVRPKLETKCSVAGWGIVKATDVKANNLLLLVDIYIYDFTKCQIRELGYTDEKTEICAGQLGGGKDACSVSITYYKYWHFCGGSIINTLHILTAAHCFHSKQKPKPEDIVIIAGESDVRHQNSSHIQYLFPSLIINHEDYDHNKTLNDIAIVRLNSFKEVKITPYVRPIIRFSARPEPGQRCDVAGWGVTDMKYSLGNDILLTTQIFVYEFKKCHLEELPHVDEKTQICAGQIAGGHDTCQGDSGGPLVCGGKLAGVVSFGHDCGLPNFPAIYTDVVAYSKWIDDIIKWDGKKKLPRMYIASSAIIPYVRAATIITTFICIVAIQ